VTLQLSSASSPGNRNRLVNNLDDDLDSVFTQVFLSSHNNFKGKDSAIIKRSFGARRCRALGTHYYGFDPSAILARIVGKSKSRR